MMNRHAQLHQPFYWKKPIILAIIVLAGILFSDFDWTLVVAEENSQNSRAVSPAFGETPASAGALAQESRKKKKKKKEEDDDDDHDGAKVISVRPAPPFSLPPVAAGKRYAYFTAFGDWGTGGSSQRHVAELMNKKAGRDSLHFILLLGDNFYGSGVTSVDDPQWQTKFE
ncbi:MAG: hypothetical protein ACREOI_38315, partial [bacterium]